MALSLDGLDLLNAPAGLMGGVPLQLPLDAIDEDPEQPRLEFDPDGLAELAATIKERGVRQPVSVRQHPREPSRWMLNFGARRLRACRLAGLPEIPAFVDSAADSYDQVIENEQRQNLQPLELALFVQRRLQAGESQTYIAQRLGKSRGYLTFICALIDAPDWLMDLYRSGRCRGLAELYELRRLHETDPAAVARWLPTAAKVTRTEVQRLKEGLEGTDAIEPSTLPVEDSPYTSTPDRQMPTGTPAPSSGPAVNGAPADGVRGTSRRASRGAAMPDAPQLKVAGPTTLWARYDGAEVIVDLSEVPQDEGIVYVAPAGGGDRLAVEAARLTLLRVTRPFV